MLFNANELNCMDAEYQRSRRKAPLETPSRFSDSVHQRYLGPALTLSLADFLHSTLRLSIFTGTFQVPISAVIIFCWTNKVAKS